jgi:hypothetical protein
MLRDLGLRQREELPMSVYSKTVATIVFLACLAQAARAAAAMPDAARPPDKKPAAVDRGEAFVSIIKQPTGEPILVIKYPWKRHLHPSIEVRTLDPSEVDNPLIRPLFFTHDLMKGEVTTAIYHCQDNSDKLQQTASFTKEGMNFEVFGARNLLGRPSVCVASRPAARHGVLQTPGGVNVEEFGSDLAAIYAARTDHEPESRAAFCLLDAWALDDDTLYLELPAKYFSKPAKIRVWLLRDKDIVWTANADWPGVPE